MGIERSAGIPLLVFAMFLPGCAPKPPQPDPAAAQFVDEMIARTNAAIFRAAEFDKLCQAYFRTHGHWPATGDDLVGMLHCDGTPFELEEYAFIRFKPVPNGNLHVDYQRRDGIRSNGEVPKPTTYLVNIKTATPTTCVVE